MLQQSFRAIIFTGLMILLNSCGGGGSSGGSSSRGPADLVSDPGVTTSGVIIQAAELPIKGAGFTVVETLPVTQLQSTLTDDIAANGTLIVTVEEAENTQDADNKLLYRLRVIDAVNFTELGQLDQALAVTRMNFNDDGVLYIDTTGQGLVKVDISDPANPVIIDRVLTPLSALESFVQGEVLYQAAYDEGLFAFSLADRNNPPLLLDHINLNGEQARALDVAGDTLLVAARNGGLLLVDISDPARLSVLSQHLFQTVWDVAAAGNIAYTSITDGLEILDISDPTASERLAFVELPGDAGKVTINQNFMVVALDLTNDNTFTDENKKQVGKGAVVYHDISTPLTADNFKLVIFDDVVEEALYKDGAIFAVTRTAIVKMSN